MGSLVPFFYFTQVRESVRGEGHLDNNSQIKTLSRDMKNQIHKTLMQGIRDLHIKLLQSNSLAEIGHCLQGVLDRVNEVPPSYIEKIQKKYWKDFSKSHIISVLKSDIQSILDGTLSRAEIAKHKATMDIVWLKNLFIDPVPR